MEPWRYRPVAVSDRGEPPDAELANHRTPIKNLNSHRRLVARRVQRRSTEAYNWLPHQPPRIWGQATVEEPGKERAGFGWSSQTQVPSTTVQHRPLDDR